MPLLYLHGLSSSDFGPALEQFLGSDAGLSAATITRLTTQWQEEAGAFNTRSLAESDYVYCWVDGIVRHEALHDRVEVRDLHRSAVVAVGRSWGQPDPGDAGKGGKQPRQRRDGIGTARRAGSGKRDQKAERE